MKRIILILAITSLFASCANETPENKAVVTTTTITADTMGLAEFNKWKNRQEMVNKDAYNQEFTTEAIEQPEPVAKARAVPVVIYRNAPARTRVAKATSKPVKYNKPVSTGQTREPYGRSEENGTVNNGGSNSPEGDVAVSQPAPVPAAKKEGWSKAAKGTAIGGASGAVVGAVISKNKSKGAVIGGVVGAAGGYIYGRSQDKKDGRY